MRAEQFISGLRERGHSVIRYQQGPRTIIPTIFPDDPLFDWLKEHGVRMVEYRHSTERPVAYEAELHHARTDERDPHAIWEAAA